MSRPCGWCSDPNRAELEQRILEGEPIRNVSLDSAYSVSAAHRHVRGHVQRDLLRALRTTDTAQLHDLAQRLAALLEDTEAARAYAKQVHDGRLLLRAVREERDTLEVLLNRLGVTDQTVLDTLAEARQLIEALRVVLVHHPGVATELATALDRLGADDLSEALGWLADQGRRRQTEQTTITGTKEPPS